MPCAEDWKSNVTEQLFCWVRLLLPGVQKAQKRAVSFPALAAFAYVSTSHARLWHAKRRTRVSRCFTLPRSLFGEPIRMQLLYARRRRDMGVQ